MRPWLAFVVLGLAPLLAGGCGGAPAPNPAPVAAPPIVFEDVTRQAGIDFVHNNGLSANRWMPETMGSGCALLDVDNDGRLDALFVDSTSWPGSGGKPGRCRLFRNVGDTRFEDVTARYGLPENIFGMGVTAGDYNNDGFIDVFITALGRSFLLRNEGGKRFTDVTTQAALRTPGWPTSAAWVDYNRDGWLDLFVCHYVKWSREEDHFTLDGTTRSYARPDRFSGDPCQLFRNERGRFVDVSAEAGVNLPGSKALGVALCDVDANRDGWPDLAVSNDTERNFLFHNQGNGRFKEVAVQAGVAVAEAGRAKAGMGIDVADYENNGQDALLITNFSGEQLTLYRRDSSGLYMDVAARAGLGSPSQQFLGFGTFFFDADLDGWLDILVANGHIQHDVSVRSSGVSYAEPCLLFRGQPDGRFLDISATAGALEQPRVARGAACGDIDGDGDLDVLLTANGGPAAVLRQAGRPAHHWLRLRLEGRKSNRSAIGATVRLRGSGGTQTRMVRSGSSYLSHSDLRLTFGLGAETRVEDVEIRWPNGAVESFGPYEADREVHIIEGTGNGR